MFVPVLLVALAAYTFCRTVICGITRSYPCCLCNHCRRTITLLTGCTISLISSYLGTENGLPSIAGEVTIVSTGSGATIQRTRSASTNFRIFEVPETGQLTIVLEPSPLLLSPANPQDEGRNIYVPLVMQESSVLFLHAHMT